MTAIPNGEVSATKFNTAFGRAGCGMKFYYRYVEGIRGVVNASLLTGIAFDVATRELHDARIAGTEKTIDDLMGVFSDEWENPAETNSSGETIEYDLSDQPDDLYGRATNALTIYTDTTEGMRPLDTQVRVEAEFEETDAKLVGFIDLVEAADKGVCISDVKTSIGSRKKWTAEDAARDAQLAIYSVMWSAMNVGTIVEAIGWRHARLGGKVEVGATHVAAPNHQSIMQRVAYWMGELERWCQSGDFPATGLDKDSWVCSEKYCDYYQRCPHGQRAQVVIPLTIGGKS